MKRLALLVLLLAACGGEDLGDCPPGSDQQQLAGRLVVASKCVVCHSSKLSGSARQSAPEDLNFDDLETVRDEAESMYGETKDGSMPPNGERVTGEDLENMRIWLACGAKDLK